MGEGGTEAAGGGWLARLKGGLSKSADKITGALSSVTGGLFDGRKIDAALLEELEDALIQGDLGVSTAAKLAEDLRARKVDKQATDEDIRAQLAESVEAILAPVAKPLEVTGAAPFIILVCGVNGSGKTTTIGKLARRFQSEGKRVLLAAGDTFRAAAIEQLKVWGERNGCPVVAKEPGADPAGLAFDAIEQARRDGMDVVLIDTAGRLQNKADLMAELEKVGRVLRKLAPEAPHASLLVLDATVGQNAHSQVEVFQKTVPLTGLIMTKLDGSAKGGVVVALADRFGLPLHAIGVGEGIDDLRPFEARDFARSLLGLNP